MGADFIRKAENRFRHQIQQQALDQKGASAMFSPAEQISVIYPCHWLNEDVTFPLGTQLVIFQRTPNSRVVVMHAVDAVAIVKDEAARELQRLFKGSPRLGGMLQVHIVRVGKPSEPFFVQATTKRKTKARVN
jgi:hypothetical protein